MYTRLIRWFFFNLLFALTPLTFVLVIRLLLGQLSLKAMEDNLSEILFFSLMVSVTALNDLDDIVKSFNNDALLSGIRLFLTLGAAWSAMLYGVFIFDSVTNLNIIGFRTRLMYVAISVAIILFVVSTAAEFFISRVVNTTSKKP